MSPFGKDLFFHVAVQGMDGNFIRFSAWPLDRLKWGWKKTVNGVKGHTYIDLRDMTVIEIVQTRKNAKQVLSSILGSSKDLAHLYGVSMRCLRYHVSTLSRHILWLWLSACKALKIARNQLSTKSSFITFQCYQSTCWFWDLHYWRFFDLKKAIWCCLSSVVPELQNGPSSGLSSLKSAQICYHLLNDSFLIMGSYEWAVKPGKNQFSCFVSSCCCFISIISKTSKTSIETEDRGYQRLGLIVQSIETVSWQRTRFTL